MSDLTATRDHARRMAAREDRCYPTSMWCADDEHERCQRFLGDDALCGCPCHPRDPGPTPAERALWTQIADEIDAYLSGPDDEPLEGM